MKKETEDLVKILKCPCGGNFSLKDDKTHCKKCKSQYPVINGKVYFIDPPRDLHLPRPFIPVLDKSQWSPWRKENYKYLRDKLSAIPDQAVVLDIGAGRSPFRDLMTKFELVSTDFYPHDLIDIVNDVTQPLPFKDKIFDVVAIANVLEHVPNPQELIDESFRVLKPGGILMAITPFMMGIHEAPYEFNRPTSFLIKKQLQNAGFIDTEIVMVSNFYNAFMDIQGDFFNAAVNANSGRKTFFLRLWRKVNKIVLILGKKMFERAHDVNYPAGYGFSAFKPIKK